MKKYTVIIIIITVILGFFTGIYLYKINKMSNMQNGTEIIAEAIENDSTKKEINNLVVSNSEEKTSPNCTIVLKVYYEVCGHLIETKKSIEETQVNMTEAELKEKFKDWELQKFTRNRNCVI